MPKTTTTLNFLQDVLVCSLGAFGGPEAHYGVFLDQMVTKKNYITQEDLVELIALTAILPGPSSTQTILAIGYRMGGAKLAVLTLLVWALPAIIAMSLFSFLADVFDLLDLSQGGLRFIAPMAVAFMSLAAYRIGQKSLTKPWKIGLFVFSVLMSYLVRSSWAFPLILLFGAALSLVVNKMKHQWMPLNLSPKWFYLIVFALIALGTFVLTLWVNHPFLFLFDAFYRYGYMVIGGGNVVIPYMVSDLVERYALLSYQEFLTGFGLVQGLPGPMFSFSAYVGGLASSNLGTAGQWMGALISGFAIFMPGVLLIFFVMPLWSELKKQSAIQVGLEGISVAAAGLMSSAALVLIQKMGLTFENGLVLLISLALLASKKVWTPLLVLAVLMAGILMS
jgi:chromate transporter